MLRNFGYGALALIGGAVTGIAISSWATPLNPPQVTPELTRVVVEPAMALASTSSRAAEAANDCSPWDVSDVAMEAALREMIRRGWRPPTQAEIVASFDAYGSPTVQSANPESLVPVRRPVLAPSLEESPGDAPSFSVDQIRPTSEGTAAQVAPTVAPLPPPVPEPAVPTEEPRPPSN